MDFKYSRRPSSPVRVGDSLIIGGDAPIAIQSMTNTSSRSVDDSTRQAAELALAGAKLVRLTAQGEIEAQALGQVRRRLREQGINTPLVADIHFNPKAAFAAATTVDKVRINPGNFVDPGRTFQQLNFTDEEYARELERLADTFGRFLDICAEHNTAVRLGVNHGSLSDRIMSRYGDSPEGMVESVMEFLRVARAKNFANIVISVKASNVVVMTRTVRLLVEAMDREGMHFPLHLGVTEAGDGREARIKSAVGIGSLLADGLGDTIRVSLSEDPVAELPVAQALVDYISGSFAQEPFAALAPFDAARQRVAPAPMVIAPAPGRFDPDRRPDGLAPEPGMNVLSASYSGLSASEVVLRASVDLGYWLLRGVGDAVSISAPGILTPEECVSLCFDILQACRLRITRTEYIACPSCGRTMFDLPTTLARVKAATQGLKGLKIGVMGCIVNGPGEMADADYGYVGARAGHVSLYRGKECVAKNIPQAEAVDALLDLLRKDGKLSSDVKIC